MKKTVSFKEKEHDLKEWISDKDFSYYVKGLIRKDMLEANKGMEERKIVKRNSKFML